MRKKRLTIPLSRQEMLWGLLYLSLELIALPSLIYLFAAKWFPGISDAESNFLFYLLNFIAVCLIFNRFIGKNLTVAIHHPLSVLLYGVLGFLLYWFSSIVMSKLTYRFMPDFSNVNDNTIAQISQDGFFLMAVGTIILVPTAEECMFRGAIFRGLYGRSRMLAYLVSALCFSAVHILGYIGAYDLELLAVCALQYLPAGLILAWCFETSGTIVTPILVHTVINAIGICSMR